MTLKPMTAAVRLVGLGLALSAHGAWASGYHFGSQSASAQGSANAGSAEAADPSTLFYNPANIIHIKGTQASGVLNVVLPNPGYSDEGSVTLFGLRTGGNNGGDFAEPTVVPHAYLTHQFSDTVTAGIGMFVPFGSRTKYDEGWTGRYNIIETELKTIAINPAFAWRVNDKFTIGGGVSAQYIHGKLAKAADFGSGALNGVVDLLTLANAKPGVPTEVVRQTVVNSLAGVIKEVSGNPTYSGGVDVEGSDISYGFNLGLLWDIDPGFRLGLAYRSKVRHTLEGTAEWDVANAANNLKTYLNGALGPGLGDLVANNLTAAYTNSDASLAVETPESYSLQAFKQITDSVALMGDITRTRHSRLKELRIDFANSLPDSVTPEHWKDTTRYSIGATWRYSSALLLRGGYAYDESPVNAENRTPSIPDNDRSWFSIGANWAYSPALSLDFAYSYIYLPEGNIDMYDNGGVTNASGSSVCDRTRNTSSCATVRGRYNLSSSLLGMQLNYRF